MAAPHVVFAVSLVICLPLFLQYLSNPTAAPQTACVSSCELLLVTLREGYPIGRPASAGRASGGWRLPTVGDAGAENKRPAERYVQRSGFTRLYKSGLLRNNTPIGWTQHWTKTLTKSSFACPRPCVLAPALRPPHALSTRLVHRPAPRVPPGPPPASCFLRCLPPPLRVPCPCSLALALRFQAPNTAPSLQIAPPTLGSAAEQSATHSHSRRRRSNAQNTHFNQPNLTQPTTPNHPRPTTAPLSRTSHQLPRAASSQLSPSPPHTNSSESCHLSPLKSRHLPLYPPPPPARHVRAAQAPRRQVGAPAPRPQAHPLPATNSLPPTAHRLRRARPDNLASYWSCSDHQPAIHGPRLVHHAPPRRSHRRRWSATHPRVRPIPRVRCP